jgi:DNA repair exonuclease SbcCD ATPase subunit
MYQIDKIRLKRFISHRDTIFHISQNKTTLIYGKNLDDPGADSNGSGKTTILKGISVGLLGVTDKSVLKEDLIMDGEESALIVIYLSDRSTGNRMKIKRKLFRKKSETVELFINDNLYTELEVNLKILRILDLSKADILNTFLINEENRNAFFSASDTKKKESIARFIDLSVLDKAMSNLDKDINKLKQEENELNEMILVIDTNIESVQNQIEFERTGRSEEISEKLSVLRNEIEFNEEKLSEYKAGLKKTIKTIREKQEEIDNLKVSDGGIEDLRKKLKKKKVEQDDKESKLSELKRTKKNIEEKLAGVVKCPVCNHEWVLRGSKESVRSLRIVCKEVVSLFQELGIELDNLNDSINILRKKISNKESQSTRLDDLVEMVDSYKKDKSNYLSKIDFSEKDIERINKEIEYLEKHKVDKKRLRELKSKLENHKEERDVVGQELNDVRAKLEPLMFWKINFGLSGFKTYLINKTLASIEGSINGYLSKFKTNLTIKINGFKVLKSGKVNENIDILVSKDGEHFSSFNRLSKGQKQRIDTCYILAMHHTINQCSEVGLDFLGLDEYFEGLDRKGQANILDILEKSQVTTLVVSHNNNDIGFENKVFVEYKNNESKIV